MDKRLKKLLFQGEKTHNYKITSIHTSPSSTLGLACLPSSASLGLVRRCEHGGTARVCARGGEQASAYVDNPPRLSPMGNQNKPTRQGCIAPLVGIRR